MKKHVDTITPFWQAVHDAETGKLNTPSVGMQGGKIDYFQYQLAVHRFELRLWEKGLKPRRQWKVGDLKKYYGLTGNDRETLTKQLDEVIELYKA